MEMVDFWKRIDIRERGIELIKYFTRIGVSLELINDCQLQFHGEMTDAEFECLKKNKNLLVRTLKPKCRHCGIELEKFDGIKYCPLGCSQ